MGDNTKIEWTNATWNPLRGCTRVSEGCRNCYAERISARFSRSGQPYAGLADMTEHGPRWTGEVRLLPEELHVPLRWRRPRMVFVNSMSDLFHEKVPDEYIAAIFGVMAMSPQHTYQILTKRPVRMVEWFDKVGSDPASVLTDGAYRYSLCDGETECAIANYVNGWSRWRGMPDDGNPLNGTVRRWPLPNVWIGVSVENQEAADDRIPYLLKVPAAVRFLSCEPVLGPVDVRKWIGASGNMLKVGYTYGYINWVVAGGESGPGARPMHPDWVRSLRDQCAQAGVPFFFKQWGEWVPNAQEYGCHRPEINYNRPHTMVGEVSMVRAGKHTAGAVLDGREWREWPVGCMNDDRAEEGQAGGQESCSPAADHGRHPGRAGCCTPRGGPAGAPY